MSFKAEEAVPAFFPAPFMMGNVSKDFCHSEKGDSPHTKEEGASARSPDGDMGGAVTVQRRKQWLRNQETSMLCFLGPTTELSWPPFPHLETSLQCLSTCFPEHWSALGALWSLRTPGREEAVLSRGGKRGRECG